MNKKNITIDISDINLPFSYRNWELKRSEKGLRKIRFKQSIKESCFGCHRFYKKIF